MKETEEKISQTSLFERYGSGFACFDVGVHGFYVVRVAAATVAAVQLREGICIDDPLQKVALGGNAFDGEVLLIGVFDESCGRPDATAVEEIAVGQLHRSAETIATTKIGRGRTCHHILFVSREGDRHEIAIVASHLVDDDRSQCHSRRHGCYSIVAVALLSSDEDRFREIVLGLLVMSLRHFCGTVGLIRFASPTRENDSHQEGEKDFTSHFLLGISEENRISRL
ncbi:hypothetical protein CLI76_08215 [Porphyromonas gingivalis]|nr:hypothetical protein CLI76_08215 [Porphyromonas gingivalis]